MIISKAGSHLSSSSKHLRKSPYFFVDCIRSLKFVSIVTNVFLQFFALWMTSVLSVKWFVVVDDCFFSFYIFKENLHHSNLMILVTLVEILTIWANFISDSSQLIYYNYDDICFVFFLSVFSLAGQPYWFHMISIMTPHHIVQTEWVK